MTKHYDYIAKASAAAAVSPPSTAAMYGQNVR